ncbi:uncharacterized protein [Aegilops tauschii subsp. strangulata]|uniref:uncharacterized protein n=1 Tax=Aegilops tauschii subsp. strangulata TaxID=200361 RepID=UPI003CC848B9
MPGILRKYAEHKLHVRKDTKPVRQPLRHFSDVKRRTIGEEVAKLLAASFIMEVNSAATFDIVVRTKQHLTLLDDLNETFANMCKYQIKLNPEKSVFGVPAGKLLSFLVSERDIEANSEKIKAIERIRKPTRLRDVLKFAGCLASADEAFWDLKRMLSTAPVLATPADKEPLLLYVAATSRSVSTVLVVERPEKGKIQSVQRPVYYLSEICYGVYFTAKKLKQYFQEHIITVVRTAPIGEIMGCWDASGRVGKWAIELAGHTILYEPRTMIKSQALADFLVDWTETQ